MLFSVVFRVAVGVRPEVPSSRQALRENLHELAAWLPSIGSRLLPRRSRHACRVYVFWCVQRWCSNTAHTVTIPSGSHASGEFHEYTTQ